MCVFGTWPSILSVCSLLSLSIQPVLRSLYLFFLPIDGKFGITQDSSGPSLVLEGQWVILNLHDHYSEKSRGHLELPLSLHPIYLREYLLTQLSCSIDP